MGGSITTVDQLEREQEIKDELRLLRQKEKEKQKQQQQQQPALALLARSRLSPQLTQQGEKDVAKNKKSTASNNKSGKKKSLKSLVESVVVVGGRNTAFYAGKATYIDQDATLRSFDRGGTLVGGGTFNNIPLVMPLVDSSLGLSSSFYF